MEVNNSVHEANVLRDFCAHAGFKILQREVAAKINDSRNEWLKADREKAEAIRVQTQAWGEVDSLLKRLILKGDAAKFAENLKTQDKESK